MCLCKKHNDRILLAPLTPAAGALCAKVHYYVVHTVFKKMMDRNGMSDEPRVSSDILDDRPPKRPKTEPSEQEPKTEPSEQEPKTEPTEQEPIPQQPKEDTPRSKAVGEAFDLACTIIEPLCARKQRLSEWDQFFEGTEETKVLKTSFPDMMQNMTKIDKSNADLWLKQCGMQILLEPVILEQYCSNVFTTEKSQEYLKNIFETLDKKDVNCNSSSIAVCADVLFRRLAATFGPSPYKDMEEWFHAIPARSFDAKKAKPINEAELQEQMKLEYKNRLIEPIFPQVWRKISDEAKRVSKDYGVPSLMFALCVYLAALGLDDETCDGTLWDMFKPIVFFNHKTRSTLHYDFLILKLAVLDRLEWKIHVAVGSYYAASVEAMPGLPEEDKDEIAKMFADNDKLHLAEFGEFLEQWFAGSCYQDENGEWQYVDKVVSSQALHQKVHFISTYDDADDNFYGTITGYTAPGLFDIEGQTRAGEERKLEIPPIFESPFLG
jgi:hypothetical protein